MNKIHKFFTQFINRREGIKYEKRIKELPITFKNFDVQEASLHTFIFECNNISEFITLLNNQIQCYNANHYVSINLPKGKSISIEDLFICDDTYLNPVEYLTNIINLYNKCKEIINKLDNDIELKNTNYGNYINLINLKNKADIIFKELIKYSIK